MKENKINELIENIALKRFKINLCTFVDNTFSQAKFTFKHPLIELDFNVKTKDILQGLILENAKENELINAKNEIILLKHNELLSVFESFNKLYSKLALAKRKLKDLIKNLSQSELETFTLKPLNFSLDENSLDFFSNLENLYEHKELKKEANFLQRKTKDEILKEFGIKE